MVVCNIGGIRCIGVCSISRTAAELRCTDFNTQVSIFSSRPVKRLDVGSIGTGAKQRCIYFNVQELANTTWAVAISGQSHAFMLLHGEAIKSSVAVI